MLSPNIPHYTKQIASGDLGNVVFREAPSAHFFPQQREVGNVFKTACRKLDSIVIGAYSHVFHTHFLHRIFNMVDYPPHSRTAQFL